MNKKSSGFAVLETLLILVIVTVIGGIGWYAYNSKQKTDKILSQADKISQNTSVTKTSINSQSSSEVYKFNDLGVQFNTRGQLKGLNYSKQDSYYYLTDDAFVNVLKTCSDYKPGDIGGGFAAISKTSGQYPKDANPIQVGVLLKQFPDFWISWGVPNGNGCSDLSKSDALHNVSSAEAQKFFKNFQDTASLAN